MLAATLCSTAGFAASRSVPRPSHATAWEQAERGREELEATAVEQRTRAEFTDAMDRFRAIYHDGPGDVHAAASVYAVAELLAEQGRALHDAKSLQAAIGQYEFLRKQYPGSSLRIPALLSEGQIEASDLDDKAAAKDHYRELLKRYPHSEQAEEARAGLESLKAGKAADGGRMIAVLTATCVWHGRQWRRSDTGEGGGSEGRARRSSREFDGADSDRVCNGGG